MRRTVILIAISTAFLCLAVAQIPNAIQAPPLGDSLGGFFRSATWPGTGEYTLHSHVGVGSLTLLGAR
jgi:hypothetical protein